MLGLAVAAGGAIGFCISFGFLFLGSIMPERDGMVAIKAGIMSSVLSCAIMLLGAFLFTCGV